MARNRHGLLAARATLAEAEGALEAAACWADFGHRLERARALLGAGRCLLAVGLPEGRARLQAARGLVATRNAGPLPAEVDAALRTITSPSNQRR